MSTPGILNGSNISVYGLFGGNMKIVGYSTSCSISISHETRSTTNSTSGGWNTRMAGNRDWEVAVDGLVSMQDNPSGTANYMQWFDLYDSYIKDRAQLLLRFGNQVNGDYYYQGYAYMTGLEISGSNEETTSFSCSFVAAGPLVQDNVGAI
jgi:predicted secreted protein